MYQSYVHPQEAPNKSKTAPQSLLVAMHIRTGSSLGSHEDQLSRRPREFRIKATGTVQGSGVCRNIRAHAYVHMLKYAKSVQQCDQKGVKGQPITDLHSQVR